jgi:hypothetical protein
MRIYTKRVDRCDGCPNIVYQHFDGEGESCPYERWFASCSAVNKPLPRDHVVPEPEHARRMCGHVPKRNVPSWCPLPEEKEPKHGR